MTPHYHINVFWSAADDCWISDVPDLRGCSAHGDSPAEAVQEAEVAIELWLESAQGAGFEVPVPRYRPAIYAAKA